MQSEHSPTASNAMYVHVSYNNNSNIIYIAHIKSEDREALGDAGLSLTRQMCL